MKNASKQIYFFKSHIISRKLQSCYRENRSSTTNTRSLAIGTSPYTSVPAAVIALISFTSLEKLSFKTFKKLKDFWNLQTAFKHQSKSLLLLAKRWRLVGVWTDSFLDEIGFFHTLDTEQEWFDKEQMKLSLNFCKLRLK